MFSIHVAFFPEASWQHGTVSFEFPLHIFKKTSLPHAKTEG